MEKALLSRNVKEATGCDHIGNMLLKSCATTVSTPLTKLFQTSINKGQFPDLWKLENVTPVIKIKRGVSKLKITISQFQYYQTLVKFLSDLCSYSCISISESTIC